MKHQHLADAIRAAFLATEATITLQDGESIDDFRSKLVAAASAAVLSVLSAATIAAGYDPTMKDMGVEDPDFRAYSCSAGPDHLVMRAHREHPWTSICLRMKWVRGADGVFSFGAPEVVTERTVYDPDPNGDAAFKAFVGAGLPATEAAGVALRKSLPATAYAAPFYAGPDGNYQAGGTFDAARSALPFHVNTCKASEATATVDGPRLRRSLEAFAGFDWGVFGDAAETVKARARELLDGARGVLPEAQASLAASESVLAKMPGAPTRADVEGLALAFEAFDRGGVQERAAAAFEALRAMARASVAKATTATESATVQRQADEVLAVAKRLGVDTVEVVKLRRRAGALQIGRLHDVAQGLV